MSFAISRRLTLTLVATLTLASTSSLFGFSKMGSVYTTNGSQADVIAALADSSNGAVINLPAGTFTWGAGGTSVIISDAITLVGAGPGNTIINFDTTAPEGTNGAIQINSGATVKAFTVNTPTNVTAFTVGGVNGWRISNISSPNLAADASYFCFISSGYGLIDNCTITAGAGNDELIFARGPNNSWQTPDSLGGATNLIIENCTFNGPGYVCDANANARFVVRFCTITGAMKIDGHGFASNTPRGIREIEIYNNTWTNSTNTFWAGMEIRGGTGMVFHNASNPAFGGAELFFEDYGYQGEWPNFGVPIAITSPGTSATITTTVPHGLSTGWTINVNSPAVTGDYTVTVVSPLAFTIPVAGGTGSTGGTTAVFQTPVNWPINDQIGVGQDPKVGGSDPLYSWGNIQNGAKWLRVLKTPDPGAITLYREQTSNPSATFLETDLIKADRDVFTDLSVSGSFNGTTGVGTGTTAQMNAITPTKVGVGFWVTDQGSWNTTIAAGTSGELYAWSGTAWVLKYTPYTYPDPMEAPIAPSNLSISSP
jgi:hypothetical protein